jgi:hypothetical protein
MIMVTYPPAARGHGLVAPRAIGRFGAAVMEARAAEREDSAPPARPAQPPVMLYPVPLRPQRRAVVRVWLPATLIFLVLSPFAFLLAPLLYFVPKYGARPFATVLGVGRVLLSLGGTDVDVQTPDALVRVRLI